MLEKPNLSPKQPMQQEAPNAGLIRYLFDQYYGDGVSDLDSGVVSGHWKEQRQLLQAVNDESLGPIPSSAFTWGCKWTGPTRRILDPCEILSHFVLLANKRRLLKFSAIAAKVCRKTGLDPTFTVFRQVCSLELLHRNLPEELRTKRMHVLMIGDGIGMLSALFKAVFPNSTITMVDIGDTLFYQAYYLQKAYPDARHSLASEVTDFEETDFVYCPTEHLETLDEFHFDVAVNIASMQEMNSHTISRYFQFLRTNLNVNNLFYCFNRERKEMDDGEVSEFVNYPWLEADRYIINEYCPWPRFYLGRTLARNGPRLLGVRVPLVNYYDGKFKHRLAILATHR